METKSLSLPVALVSEFEHLLIDGGFDVGSLGEPWATETVSWEAFLCHKKGGVVSASIAVMLNQSERPFVTISTTRKTLGIWIRPRDKEWCRRSLRI
jgi:hypothetical protein